jgi:oxygen-dependent protoporphyrinogen oxidase
MSCSACTPLNVAIIGAGLTGLSAALELQRQGAQVTLLEKNTHCGGVLTTRRRDDWLYELGPSTLMRGNPVVESLLEELQLHDQLVAPPKIARNRFIIRNQQIVALPNSPLSFFTSPWITAGGKLRLLCEPFQPKGKNRELETVADFARRRLGPQVLDYGINPFVSGIHAGDPEQLSLKLAFPRLYQAEEVGGSLFNGFRKLAKARSKPRPPKGIVSFRQGLSTLPERMREHFRGELHTEISLQTLAAQGAEWQIRWKSRDGNERQQTFQAVIIACWSPAIEALLPRPQQQSWPQIDYSSTQVVTLGFRREDVQHPLNGFGVLAPASERLPFLGALFASSLFPNRAPENHVLMHVFLGGKTRPDLIGLSQQQFQQQIFPSLAKILGIQAQPVLFDTHTWSPAIPQYTPAHETFLQARQQLERNHKGLFLAGNTVDGISMPHCLQSGYEAAKRVLG